MISRLAKLQSIWQSAPYAFAFIGAMVIFAITLIANQGSGAGQIVSAALAFGSFYALVGIGQMFVITSGPVTASG